MTPERRNHARRVLYSPEYLDMGADNGGVVVNLSEGGLAFQAVGPVAPHCDIPLSFSLGPGYRIDVKARVVWVNSNGKLGGAAFGKLSKDSQSLIREWLGKPEVEHESENAVITSAAAREAQDGASEGPLPLDAHTSAIATQMPEERLPEEMAARNGILLPSVEINPDLAASPLPADTKRGMPSSPSEPTEPVARGTHLPAPAPTEKQARTPLQPAQLNRERSKSSSYSVAPSISAWSHNGSPSTTRTPGLTSPLRSAENIFARSPSRFEPERRRRGLVALAIIAIVIAAGAVVAFYARTHRQQIGNKISQIGNTIAGSPAAARTTTAPQVNSSAANPNEAPASSQIPIPPRAASQPPAPSPTKPTDSATQTTGSQPPNSTSGATKAPISKGQPPVSSPKTTPSNSSNASPALGQAEYQRAENYLNGKGVSQDSAQAAEWFWRSLEAGNTDAAVPLADLYLAGNGVSRSCTQARILLDTAAQKNNTIAIKKLAELPDSCH